MPLGGQFILIYCISQTLAKLSMNCHMLVHCHPDLGKRIPLKAPSGQTKQAASAVQAAYQHINFIC